VCVEPYGGGIWVESQAGGSLFHFHLAGNSRFKRGDLRWTLPALSAREDNPADVELLRWALQDAGLDCDLTVIDDGRDALDFVLQRGKHAASSPPDPAILDWNCQRTMVWRFSKDSAEIGPLTACQWLS
jgi:hypothetical protein